MDNTKAKTVASSRYPAKGMKSGIRSNGDMTYTRAPTIDAIVHQGVSVYFPVALSLSSENISHASSQYFFKDSTFAKNPFIFSSLLTISATSSSVTLLEYFLASSAASSCVISFLFSSDILSSFLVYYYLLIFNFGCLYHFFPTSFRNNAWHTWWRTFNKGIIIPWRPDFKPHQLQ